MARRLLVYEQLRGGRRERCRGNRSITRAILRRSLAVSVSRSVNIALSVSRGSRSERNHVEPRAPYRTRLVRTDVDCELSFTSSGKRGGVPRGPRKRETGPMMSMRRREAERGGKKCRRKPWIIIAVINQSCREARAPNTHRLGPRARSGSGDERAVIRVGDRGTRRSTTSFRATRSRFVVRAFHLSALRARSRVGSVEGTVASRPSFGSRAVLIYP